MRILGALLATTMVLATSPLALKAAHAGDLNEGGVDFLNFAIGHYDIFDNDNAIDLRVEYRPASSVFIKNLKPWVGLEVTTDASLWVGGGLLYDWNFQDSWYLTPSFGAGLYAQGSSDLDLGHPIEFRSQLEISYAFDNDARVGLAFSHLSNADLDRHNPGTEILSLSISYPF
ncbi:MAG: acyloxyacyl hydrolase [Alphaproteobacteria bacterium]